MDQETKQEFGKIHEQIEELSVLVTDGFAKITNEMRSEFVKLSSKLEKNQLQKTI